jgi:lipoprotein Spr
MLYIKNILQRSILSGLLIIAVSLSSCRSNKEVSKTNTSSSKAAKVKEKYALVLKIDESKIENIKLYAFIDEWYGVPYKYGGNNKSGIDCSNFTATLYSTIYNKSISGSSSGIFEKCKVVSKSNLEEGDLVFFKIDGNKISHIGVYLQNNKFVHATTKKGVMIDDLDEPYYKKYYFKSGRINN